MPTAKPRATGATGVGGGSGGITGCRVIGALAAAGAIGWVLSAALGGVGGSTHAQREHDERYYLTTSTADDSQSAVRGLAGKKRGDAGDAAAGARAPCADHPPSTALAHAFKGEAFRVEKIVQAPGTDDWRLCYPGPKRTDGSDPAPVCPTTSFFIVNQRDGVSDGVVDWLQGCVF